MNTMTKQGISLIAMLSACATLSANANAQDDFSIDVGGRIMIDYANANGEVSGLDLSDTELRRLRVNVSGKLTKNVKYKAEINTNDSERINFEDAYLQWAPNGGKWNIKAGQFKTPNSLDEATSSRFMSTIERSGITDAFELNRRLGVSVNTKGSNYTFSAGIFGDNLLNLDDQQSKAAAARATFNPVKTDETTVHLGASFRYRDQNEDASNLRYRQRAYTHIPSRIISTGRLAQSDTLVGVEAAVLQNKFWAAGEYAVTDANCEACATDPNLSGGYIEAGVFIGGRKVYKDGKFNRPKVDNPVTKGGMGAASFVARYDKLDLEDSGVDGGKLDTLVLGADWWPTKNTRLSINYFNADANLGTSTSGLDSTFAALVQNDVQEEKVDGFIIRAYYDF